MSMVDVLEALRESNAIEGVTDLDSFVQAMFAWAYLSELRTLKLPNILKAHKILMLHQPLEPNYKGYLRDINVQVGGTVCPSPMMLRPALEDWLNHEWPNADSITSHVAFERIHPFVDGNGRIGRMLMFWRQIEHEGGLKPWPTAEKRQEYYKLFL